jgi:hypothetical protein
MRGTRFDPALRSVATARGRVRPGATGGIGRADAGRARLHARDRVVRRPRRRTRSRWARSDRLPEAWGTPNGGRRGVRQRRRVAPASRRRRSSRPGPPGESNERTLEFAAEAGSVDPRGFRARDHDEIIPLGDEALMGAKPLADPPPHARAFDGRSDPAAGRDAESRSISCRDSRRLPGKQEHERPRRHTRPFSRYPPEILGRPQAVGAAEALITAAREGHFDGVDTVSRLRPLARRRLRTAWPPLVAIRSRKPWVRRRRMRLG